EKFPSDVWPCCDRLDNLWYLTAVKSSLHSFPYLRLVPNIILDPLTILLTPNARITETISDLPEFLLGHAHIIQPIIKVLGNNMIMLTHHFNTLFTRHVTVTDIFRCMVRSTTIAKFNKF